MLFRGALLSSGVRVVNNPDRQSRANQKPLQLSEAWKVGLRIPRTLMTNDPRAARTFVKEFSTRCIHKPFNQVDFGVLHTRRCEDSDLADLESLLLAPIILQEEVPGLDLRVNVFGDRVFAAAATVRAEAKLDWREDHTVEWYPYDLDGETSARCIALVRKLGLDYGCIDLKAPEGELPCFLEINPAGQFLFIEIHTGQALVDSLCRILVN